MWEEESQVLLYAGVTISSAPVLFLTTYVPQRAL